MSHLISVLQSAVIPSKAETQSWSAEKGGKSLMTPFQRVAVLINRSLSDIALILDGSWSAWVANPEIFGLVH